MAWKSWLLRAGLGVSALTGCGETTSSPTCSGNLLSSADPDVPPFDAPSEALPPPAASKVIVIDPDTPSPEDSYELVLADDLDEDGDVELVVAGRDGLHLYVNDGSAGFTAGPPVLPELNNFEGVVAADFNADGGLELAAVTDHGLLVVLQNQGQLRFEPLVTFALLTAVEAMSAADFDRDGRIDLALTNRDTGAIDVFWNEDGGRTWTQSSLSVGWRPEPLAIADADGDGALDIGYARQPGSGDLQTVGVLMNRGNRAFDAAVEYEASGSPDEIAWADLDGDGAPELVSTGGGENNFAAPDLSVFWNDGKARLGARSDILLRARSVPAFPNGPRALAVAGRATGNELPVILAGGTSVSMVGAGEGHALSLLGEIPMGIGNVRALTVKDFDGRCGADIAVVNQATVHLFLTSCEECLWL